MGGEKIFAITCDHEDQDRDVGSHSHEAGDVELRLESRKRGIPDDVDLVKRKGKRGRNQLRLSERTRKRVETRLAFSMRKR